MNVDFIPNVMGRISLRIFFGCLLLAYTATVHAERIWIPDSNGCQLFDYPLTPGESFTWSGLCKAGKIDGQGELRFFKNGVQTMLYRGDMRNGVREGRGVQEQNGEKYEGELKGNLWAGKGTHNLEMAIATLVISQKERACTVVAPIIGRMALDTKGK